MMFGSKTIVMEHEGIMWRCLDCITKRQLDGKRMDPNNPDALIDYHDDVSEADRDRFRALVKKIILEGDGPVTEARHKAEAKAAAAGDENDDGDDDEHVDSPVKRKRAPAKKQRKRKADSDDDDADDGDNDDYSDMLEKPKQSKADAAASRAARASKRGGGQYS